MLDKLDLEVSRRTVFQAVAAAATVLAIGTAQAGPDTAPTFRTTGGQFTFVEPRPAVPAIRLELVNGSTLDLGTPIGKPRLISVWATWCPPCRRELPTLERLAKLLGAEVQVTAVSIDREGSARVRAFLDNLGVRLPSALDPTGRLVKSVGIGRRLQSPCGACRSATWSTVAVESRAISLAKRIGRRRTLWLSSGISPTPSPERACAAKLHS